MATSYGTTTGISWEPFSSSEKHEETLMEKEFKVFTNKFANWKKKISKDIPIGLAINKDNFIIYLRSKRFSKSKNKNAGISVSEILNFYDDLIQIEPHNGDYLYYDRKTGMQIRDIRQFLIIKGRLKKEDDKAVDKERPVKCITKENNTFKYVNMLPEVFNTFKSNNFDNKTGLMTLGLAKISSCNESAVLFGYKNIKSQMVESQELFEISSITPNFVCKKDGQVRNIIEVKNNGKSYKFLINEVELMLPELDKLIKGYKPLKDRQLKEGGTAKLITAKRTTLPRKAEVRIKQFKKIGGTEYATVEFDKKNYVVNKKQLRVI